MNPTKNFCIFVFNFFFVNYCIRPILTLIKRNFYFDYSCTITSISHGNTLYSDDRIAFLYPNNLISQWMCNKRGMNLSHCLLIPTKNLIWTYLKSLYPFTTSYSCKAWTNQSYRKTVILS